MKRVQTHIIFCIGSLLVLGACQKPQLALTEAAALKAPEVQQASQTAAGAVTAADLESHLWDVSYAIVLNQADGNSPTIQPENISKTILDKVGDDKLTDQQKADLNDYFQKFYQIHNQILNSNKTTQEKLKALTSAELGKSTDPDLQAIQKQLEDWRTQLHALLLKDGLIPADAAAGTPATPATPDTTTTPPVTTPDESGKDQNTPPAVNPVPPVATPPVTPPKQTPAATLSLSGGAKKTLAVAYQSCQLEKLPPINKNTAKAQGVQVLGKAVGGIGYRRKIVDPQLFTTTQYYYRDFSLGAQCIDVRKNPMIYNFGGKPNVETTNQISSIDLFSNGKNTPGVSAQLGIDCSAYVFTSFAAAGFRIKSNTPMKPILVNGVDSDMFIDPKGSGLSCVNKVSMGASGSLRAGDVIAEKGHVVIIGDVGADPLGIHKVTQDADCDKMSPTNFDFVVYQSSAIKGGIGINKFLGKDYAIEDSLFQKGIAEYAQQACHAKFAKKNVQISSKNISVDRVLDTPACRQAPTPLVGEACVDSCL